VARRAASWLACAAALSIALAGCGGTDVAEPEPRPVESVDPVPELPGSWHVHANAAGGFAFGLPRGWTARDRGTRTEVRSFDRLVAITFTADRTGEALDVAPPEFASRAAAATGGFEERLQPDEAVEFRHPYEAAVTTARGTNANTGVEQEVSVIALRRGALAVLTATVFASSTAAARDSRALAERVVRTLRSRPVAAAAP
jgi:hypothetical protein